MAERIIAHRKSQTYLHSVLPVRDTHEELVKKKLESGKFLFTITGLIKIAGIIILIAGLAIFLAKPTCPNTSSWYEFLFPITVGIHVIAAVTLHIIFSAGLTVSNPGKWVNTDIIVNLLLGIVTIICSIITNSSCGTQSSIHKVPGPLGIAGGGLLIVSCASIFLLYRYREDEPERMRNPNNRRQSSVNA